MPVELSWGELMESGALRALENAVGLILFMAKEPNEMPLSDAGLLVGSGDVHTIQVTGLSAIVANQAHAQIKN